MSRALTGGPRAAHGLASFGMRNAIAFPETFAVQNPRGVLLHSDRLRELRRAAIRLASAQQLRDVCDLPGKCIRGITTKKLTSAKTTGGFVADVALFIDENPVEGRAILRFLINVHRSHPDDEPMDIRKIILAEQEADADEDVAEVEALVEDTPQAWENFAAKGKRARAKLDRAVAAAEQRARLLRQQRDGAN